MNFSPPPFPARSPLPALSNFRFQLRGFLAFSESAAESLGTTSQQYQLLQVVGESSSEGVSITYIAERLLLRHNSAVELVDRAQRSGLVIRQTDLLDQRRLVVTLTSRGGYLLEQLVERHLVFLQQAGPDLIGSLGQLIAAPLLASAVEPVC
jgi:DNA-binding MarR family transcriptional regulator